MLGRLITLLLVGAFAISGFMKLSPAISPEVHNKMVDDFHKFYPVNPLVEHKIIQSTPDNYRLVIGATEIVCAILLLIGPSALVSLAYLVLAVIMVGAAYTLHKVQYEPQQQVYIPLGFLALISYQLLFGGGAEVRAKTD